MGFYKAVHGLLESLSIPSFDLTKAEEEFVHKLVEISLSKFDGAKSMDRVNIGKFTTELMEAILPDYVDDGSAGFVTFRNEFLFPTISPKEESSDRDWAQVNEMIKLNTQYPNHRETGFTKPDFLFTASLIRMIAELDRDLPGIKEAAIKFVTYFFVRTLYIIDNEYTERIRKLRGITPFASKETSSMFGDLYS